MRLRSTQRLRRGSDIREVRTDGARFQGVLFAAWWRLRASDSGGSRPRICVIASRAVGGAVLRNRAKRRLREVFRNNQEKLPSDIDLVLAARAKLPTSPYSELERRFLQLCAYIQKSRKP